MRKYLISIQVALIALLAITGALASPDPPPACPLGEAAQVETCKK